MQQWREQEQPPFAVDFGSFHQRAGYVGDDAPRGTLRTQVGALRPDFSNSYKMAGSGMKRDKNYLGAAIEQSGRRALLDLQNPINPYGHVSDWDTLEQVIEHLFFAELRVDPHAYGAPVIFSDNTSISELSLKNGNAIGNVDQYREDVSRSGYRSSVRQRERLMELMYERFDVPGFYSAPSSLAACYSMGRTTQFIINTCCGMTQAVPVFQGIVMQDAISCGFGMGPVSVDALLKKELLLQQHQGGLSFQNSAEMEILREIKERVMTVETDRDDELIHEPVEFELPDKSVLIVGPEARRNPGGLVYDLQ